MHVPTQLTMNFFCKLIIYILIGALQSNAAEISVTSDEPVKTLPRSRIEPISLYAILTCSIMPANASVVTRWITPNGQIITSSTKRYILQQGRSLSGLSTFLAIHGLSYRDAGLYSCEAIRRPSSVLACGCEGFPVSASTQLVLQVYLEAPISEVIVKEAMIAHLHCEIRGYILSDEHLLWYKGEEIIHNGVDRYTITFSNGTLNSAQNGGVSTIPSRISILEISSTVLSDAGEYFCRVRDKEVLVSVRLSVERDSPAVTTDNTAEDFLEPIEMSVFEDTRTTAPLMERERSFFNNQDEEDIKFSLNKCRTGQTRIVSMTIGITFVATLLTTALLTAIVVCLWLKLWQQKGKLANKTSPLNGLNEDSHETRDTSAIDVQPCELEGLQEEISECKI